MSDSHPYLSLQLKCMLTSLPFARVHLCLLLQLLCFLLIYHANVVVVVDSLHAGAKQKRGLFRWSFPQDHATGAIRGVETYTTTCDSPHFNEVSKYIPLVIEGSNLTIYVIALQKTGDDVF